MCDNSYDGWEQLQLGGVATLQRGFDLPIQERQVGIIPVYGSNGIDGHHNRAAVEGPGVITGRSGSIGNVFYEKEDFWPLNTSLYVKNFHGNEPRFVSKLLESLNLKSYAASTGVPSLNRNFIHPLRVNLPPLAEQRAIATVLDTMDEAIRRTEDVLAKLRQVKAGMLHDLLTRGLDENGELRDPIRHPEQFKDSPLGRIPKDWESYTLGSIGSWVGGHTPSKGVDKYWRGGEVVWITPKDVKGQILHDSQDHLTVQAVNATGLLLFPKNSIFIVFRSGILKHSLPVATCTNPFTVNQDLKVFISNRGVISEYISIFLEKDSEFIINTAVKSGTTVESIDRSIFESMRIALPNEKEQKIIIERIKYVSNRLEREKINKQKLLSIKQGLLHDLLTGRVCVPPHLLEASS